MLEILKGKRLGVALCGSFCTFKYVFAAIDALQQAQAQVFPIMSFNAAAIDTRFGKAEEHLQYLYVQVKMLKVLQLLEHRLPMNY